jgi:hypothetical protein
MFKFAISLTIFLALAAFDVSADTLNGSFETTTSVVGAGTCGIFAPGSSGVTSWTVVGAPGTDVAVCNTTFVQFGISFPAENGSNSLDLTGLGSNSDTEGVEQTIATTIGDSYTLSFFVGNVDSPSTGFGVTSTVDVFADGTSLGAFTNSCTTCTTTWAWQMFTITFTAASASTTLRFLNGDPANDNANGLENMSLVDNGPIAAPEPSLVLPLGMALVCLAGYRRRRAAGRAT